MWDMLCQPTLNPKLLTLNHKSYTNLTSIIWKAIGIILGPHVCHLGAIFEPSWGLVGGLSGPVECSVAIE